MLDALSILRELSAYIDNIPVEKRIRIAAKFIRDYRRSIPHSSKFDLVFGYLKVEADDVAKEYHELYGRPLFLNYVPPLQEGEVDKYTSASATGVTNTLLYYLRSQDILELRRRGGELFVNNDGWQNYINRNNGYASLTQAVTMLGISRPYTRKLVQLNILPATKVETGKTCHWKIAFSDIENLKPRLEWINLSEAARRYDKTRERTRQILKSHTLSAHTDKRSRRKKIRTHWRRIRTAQEVLVRALDFDLHFQRN